MSALSKLNTRLHHYWSLPHHDDVQLNDIFNDVQTWQRDRIRKTHASLFAHPNHQKMADYFLSHLYGDSDTLNALVSQLERIVPKAQKIEKLAPSTALETGTLGVSTAITATELDVDIAQWLQNHNLVVTKDNMLSAYQAVNAADARRQQLDNLKEVCYRTDKYLNSFILKKAFKLTKNQAYKHDLNVLYDFIDAGFVAMQPLKSVKNFVDPFCERELEVIKEIHRQS